MEQNPTWNLLILLIVFCYPVTSSRIIDRFGGSYRKDLPCKVWVPQTYKESAFTTPGHTGEIGKTIFKALKIINCTIIGSDYVESGYPFPNASYTGLIGMMQRRELDLAFLAARPDSLPHEPVLIGPMVLEADAALITAKSGQKPINRELLELVNDVDFLVYGYLLIIIVIFCISYMITTYCLEMEKEDEDQDD